MSDQRCVYVLLSTIHPDRYYTGLTSNVEARLAAHIAETLVNTDNVMEPRARNSLIFALHYVAFMYLVTIAAGMSRPIGLSVDLAAAAGYAVIAPYLILALKRVYAESTGVILLKASSLLLLTIILNNIASFVAIRMTLALV